MTKKLQHQNDERPLLGSMESLDGVASGKLSVFEFFRSADKAIEILKTDRATIGSGDYGAVEAWIDDKDRYRGSYSVWGTQQSSIDCGTPEELHTWIEMEYAKCIEQMEVQHG